MQCNYVLSIFTSLTQYLVFNTAIETAGGLAWHKAFCNLLLLNSSKVAKTSLHMLLLPIRLTCRIEVVGLLIRFTTDRKITIASCVYTEKMLLRKHD